MSIIIDCSKELGHTSLFHTDTDCALVRHRITCDECGYPACEARYNSVEEYWKAWNQEGIGL